MMMMMMMMMQFKLRSSVSLEGHGGAKLLALSGNIQKQNPRFEAFDISHSIKHLHLFATRLPYITSET